MKILFSAEKFYPPISGAELSVLTLFKELAKEHEVEGICTGDKNEIIEYEGIKIYHVKTPYSHLRSWVKRYFLNKLWFNLFDSFLEKRKYDLVMTQTELTPASTIIAKNHRIPVLIFVRDYQHFCLSILRDVKGSEVLKRHNCLKHATWKYKVQYPFFSRAIKWFELASEEADCIVANSKFVQKIARAYGVDSEVVYPFIRLDDYKVKERNPRYVTLVRPWIRKGVDIFLKITDELPDHEFLAVGGSEKVNEIKRRRNVKYIPWADDMKNVYAQTKLLLAPAIWKEPFSRTPLEAMHNGIPCIASNSGGLPESIGDAGIIIDDVNDIDVWVDAIEKLESNKKFYRKLSKKSRKKSRKFDFKIQYKRFEKIIEKYE